MPPSFDVLLYSRVSSARQAREGHSIEAQPEDLRRWAEARGWSVVGELADPGRTGRNADRQGFNLLMDLVRERRPDAVLVTRLSRFMRNARLTLNAVHELRELGVALICTDEPIDTRQRGVSDMLLAILATLAEWESERMAEYAVATHQRLLAQGRWGSGRVPFGYRLDKATGQLEIVEEQAEVVRFIFDFYTRSGKGIGTIIKELAGRGVRSPRGEPTWGLNVVAGILKNGVYAGTHALGMTAPPIVSQQVFDRAQVLRSSNRSVHPPRVDPWPLQNRLRCSWCGARFRCYYARGRRRFYRCKGRSGDSQQVLRTGERCTAPSLPAEDVEAQILQDLLHALATPANFRAALETAIMDLRSRLADLEADVAPVRRELEQVNEELRRLTREWIREHLSEAEVDLLRRSALERKENLEARLAALGPDRVEEMERARALMATIEEDLAGAEDAAESRREWNVYTRVLPQELVDHTGDLDLPRVAVFDPHEVLRDLLARLQAEVWFGPDGLTVKGLIEVPITDVHAFDCIS
jgi:site-specific DNA recombinase